MTQTRLIRLAASAMLIAAVLKGIYVTVALPEARVWTAATATASLALAARALLWRLPPWRDLFAAILLNVLASALLIIDRVHFAFFDQPASLASLPDAWQLPSVSDAVVERLGITDALLVIDALIVIVIAWLIRWRLSTRPEIASGPALRHALGAVLASIVLAIPGMVAMIQDRDNVFEWRASRSAMAGTLGVLPYHVYDAVELAAVAWSRWDVSQDDAQDAAQLIEERRLQRQQSSPAFGAAMGKNLIIVQAESLQQFVLGLRIGDRLVTPALDAFAMESVRFSNFHEQTWLGATSDAMFTALHSLHALPPGHGAVATRLLTNIYQGLPNLLAQHGYSTFAAMGAPGRFWHIDRLWTRLGFQRTAYDHDYPGSERFGQGIADVPFFEQTAARLTQLQTPFIAFLVSVSTHIPFHLPPAERRLDLGALSGTTLGKYLDSISYFDRAFGRFLSELARTGLLETSVIVVYGDHEAWLGPSPELAALTAPSGNPEFGYWRSRKRVPLLIRLPSGRMSGQRDVAGGQLDIAPTLLSLLGVQAPQAIMLGADLFQPRETPVVFRDGSVLHGNVYLVQGLGAGGFSCYEAGSGRAVGCDQAPGGLDAATRELQASDFILYGNLVPRLIARSTATAR